MMMILVIVCLQVASAERVQVVTPENHLPHGVVKEEGNVTEADDTYLRAYREVHNIAERRNPLSSYGDQSYSTLTHSSYIDDDVYPEFSYKAHPSKHRYPTPAAVYGPPSPVSYYHHHHHAEPVSHHTVIGLPVVQPFHVISSYMNKFGLHKVLTLIAKIVVLKIILKFVMVVGLFFFLPAVLPREKEKDETAEDRLMSSLNDITDRVWSSITENEDMMEEEEEQEEDEENGQNSNEHENHKTNDLDEVDLKLINKLIREWKEEHFGGPDQGSAIRFLERCMNAANRVLGVTIQFLKMKNNNMDVLDGMVLNRLSTYVKQILKTWPKLMSAWKAG